MIVKRPIVPESNQRYWRRRANRQVRKARRARSLGRLSLILFVNGTLAAVLIFTGARTIDRVKESRFFSMQRIEIEGIERAPMGEIRQILEQHLGSSVLEADLPQIGRGVSKHPWIASASVRRRLPDGVRVTVVERRPCAVAVIGGVAHVVDETGFVIGPSGAGFADDLPVLTGLEHGDAGLASNLRRAVRRVRRLRQVSPAFVDEVSELDFSRIDRVTVTPLVGGPEILLNANRVELNVRDYLRHRGEIVQRAGSMRYIDLRWRDRISVMPTIRKTS